MRGIFPTYEKAEEFITEHLGTKQGEVGHAFQIRKVWVVE